MTILPPDSDGNKTADHCDCLAAKYYHTHDRAEHERSGCGVRWTEEGPPCGGCVDCLEASAYMREFSEELAGRKPWPWDAA